MKKLIALMLLVAMVLPVLAACGGTNNNSNSNSEATTTKPELSVDEKTRLGIEQVMELKVNFVPGTNNGETSADLKKLTLTSSDSSVVKCNSEKGTITGVKLGTATVTITANDPTTENGTVSVTTEVTVYDPLKGSSAAFFGDSICMASTWDKEHQWWGWAGRINEVYGLNKYKNAGVDGASLSTCRGNNRIINYLNNVIKTGESYHYIVLHGGTNDGWDAVPIGTMSESYNPADFDTSTFAGGLEELFFTAKQNYPNSKIGYIINFRMTYNAGNLKDMTAYYTLAKEICKKWDIPYLDLHFDENFLRAFDYTDRTLLPDLCHPSSIAYEILYQYVAKFMRQLEYGLDVKNQK